jgi:hypothetical protein
MFIHKNIHFVLPRKNKIKVLKTVLAEYKLFKDDRHHAVSLGQFSKDYFGSKTVYFTSAIKTFFGHVILLATNGLLVQPV